LSFKKASPLEIGAASLYGLGVNTLKNEEQPNFTIGKFNKLDI